MRAAGGRYGIHRVVCGWPFWNGGGELAARPQVLGVSPKTGYARGGAIASVVGAGFMDEKAACVYGGVHAPAEFISSSLLRCESPSLSLGAVTVEVAAGSGTIVSESEMTVSVIADMRVQYVTPSSGPTQGGNVITVYGKYFVGIEPVACKLGSIGPLDARDNDATGLNLTAGLECVAPARPAGAARVAVGIRTSGYTDDDVQYLYASALAVQAVMPSAGETTSLRTISVFGMTLRSGVGSCVFGPRASAGVCGATARWCATCRAVSAKGSSRWEPADCGWRMVS